MAVIENNALLTIAAQKSIVRIDDADNSILQMRIALNQVGQEVITHQVGRKHFCCMQRNFVRSTRRNAVDKIHILRLAGSLPYVMVVVAGNVENVFVKKWFAIFGENQLNQA